MIIRIGSCISYYSYIKPQLSWLAHAVFPVVYHTIPTSNHNNRRSESLLSVLYIILFLHQTTTLFQRKEYLHPLYIILFLHQTTTVQPYYLHLCCCISYYSYIKPQLSYQLMDGFRGCISYYSYIKPQPLCVRARFYLVVYHTIPTSNHNLFTNIANYEKVVYHTIPTSNHNCPFESHHSFKVVYHTIPTSNHNWLEGCWFCREVVYHTIPTSNHNLTGILVYIAPVVYHTIPTSNHNYKMAAQ